MPIIKKQILKPDTCKSEIEQTFDYDTNPATLVKQECLRVCAEHTSFSKPQERAHEDNVRKNEAREELFKNVAGLRQTLTAAERALLKLSWAAQGIKKEVPTEIENPDIEYKWSFDKDRNLEVELVSASMEQKSEAKT